MNSSYLKWFKKSSSKEKDKKIMSDLLKTILIYILLNIDKHFKASCRKSKTKVSGILVLYSWQCAANLVHQISAKEVGCSGLKKRGSA